MGGTKFYPVYAESSRWNTLIDMMADRQVIADRHDSERLRGFDF